MKIFMGTKSTEVKINKTISDQDFLDIVDEAIPEGYKKYLIEYGKARVNFERNGVRFDWKELTPVDSLRIRYPVGIMELSLLDYNRRDYIIESGKSAKYFISVNSYREDAVVCKFKEKLPMDEITFMVTGGLRNQRQMYEALERKLELRLKEGCVDIIKNNVGDDKLSKKVLEEIIY